jgi:polar amino acid transport system substrate-binding protein
VPWVAMQRKVKGLAALPQEHNCQKSTEKTAPVGLAIDKNQPAFLDWLRAVAGGMQTKLEADEQRIVEKMQ